MATWAEVVSVLNQHFRVRPGNPDFLAIDISALFASGRSRDWNDLGSGIEQVYVHRSWIDNQAEGTRFEFMEVNGSLGPVGSFDVLRTVAHAGQFIGAKLAYAAASAEGGALAMATSIPLTTLDARNPLGICQPVTWIAMAANAARSDLANPAGHSVARHTQIQDALWYVFRQAFKASPEIVIDREFPNGGAFFHVAGRGGVEHPFMIGLYRSGIDNRVMLERFLGNAAEVNLARAAEACKDLPGGVVSGDGLVTLRISLSLSELNISSFNAAIAKLVLAAESYLSA